MAEGVKEGEWRTRQEQSWKAEQVGPSFEVREGGDRDETSLMGMRNRRKARVTRSWRTGDEEHRRSTVQQGDGGEIVSTRGRGHRA